MTMTGGSRVRMSPESRREQLLELGTQLLASLSLEELSIEALAERAGISRGLLYHYFGSKQDFHLAVVRRAVEDLYAITAPRDIEDPLEQMVASLGAYLDYVVDNYAGYVSLVRAAKGGNEELRAIYDEARRSLTDRIFEAAGPDRLAEMGVLDTPGVRMLVDGWAAMVEEVVVAWATDPHGMDREQVLRHLAGALPAVVSA